MEPEEIHKALKILVSPPTTGDKEGGLDASFTHNIKEVIKYLCTLISLGRPVCALFHDADKEYHLPCRLDEITLDLNSIEKGIRTDAPSTDNDGSHVHKEEELNPNIVSQITSNEDNVSDSHLDASKNSESKNNTRISEIDAKNKDVNADCDLRWNYVKCNLKLLLCLKLTIQSAAKNFKLEMGSKLKATNPEHSAPPLAPDTLSFEQQKVIMTSLQFTACLGICPNLIKGVGIPVECRSEFGRLLRVSIRQNLSPAEREFHMWTCVSVMLDCVQQPTLGSLILTRHLNDILAALIQICHAPRKINKASKSSNPGDSSKCEHQGHQGVSTSQENQHLDHHNVSTSQESQLEPQTSASNTFQPSVNKHLSKEQIRAMADAKLKELVAKIYQPALVKELLMLQSGAALTVHNQQQVFQKHPPNWLCRVCSSLLTECLLRPNGVLNVLKAVLETSNLGADNFDWRKCDAAARILSAVPSESLSQEEYFSVVGPQIVDLLHSKDKLMIAVYLKVASKTISILFNSKQHLAEKHILGKMLQPLNRCINVTEHEACSEPVVFVSESELQYSIESLHKLVVLGSDPGSNIIRILDPYIVLLLHMYAFCRSSVTYLRQTVEDIIVNYMKQSDVEKAVSALKCFIISDTSSDISLNELHKKLTFVAGDNGGIVILLTPKHNSMMLQDDRWETLSSATIHLLKLTASDELIAKFFISTLKRLTEIVSIEAKKDVARQDELSVEDNVDDTMFDLYRSLAVLDIISKMSETLGYSCLIKNTTHVLDFVTLTLERCVQVLDSTEDVGMGMFESETVTMAMGLLAAMIEGEVQMTSADFEQCQGLLPLLHHVNDSHPDPFMKQLAMDLQVAIATHGHVKSSASSTKYAPKTDPKHNTVKKQQLTAMDTDEGVENERVCGVLESSDNGLSDDLSKHSVEVAGRKQDEFHDVNMENVSNPELVNKDDLTLKSSQSKVTDQSLEQVLKDLQDPMIPIKGHALVALRRLIENRDPGVIPSRQDDILEIFREHLKYSDTYIYLAAIQGLAALAMVNTDHVIEVLVDEYVNEQKDKINPAELRMKIGEVLVKTIRTLGEMAPKYRDILVRAFLYVAKDPDHHIRASSLSNLAEVCALLRYSLGNNIQQILNCVGALIRSDPEEEVRRAAAMFVHKLLDGLGPDTLKILADSIKDLYHQLKMTLATEKDDIVVLHVQMTLEALDTIMRKFIFPEFKLEKKIHILSPPSD